MYHTRANDLLRYSILNPDERENAKFIKNNYDTLRKVILNNNPSSIKLLEQAFKAHEAGEYFLSTSSFIILAEKICKDRIGYCLFYRFKYKSFLKILNKNFIFPNLEALNFFKLYFTLKKDIETHDLFLPERKRSEGFSGLNRHQIMHGECRKFDLEEYSFKALSFLSMIDIAESV